LINLNLKKMKQIIYTFIFSSIFALVSCEKNNIADNLGTEQLNPANANVKFINAYTSAVPAGAPGVGATRFYIYQNGNKLNGNALSSPGSWPGPSTYASLSLANNFVATLDRRVGNDYGKVAVGDTAFKGIVALSAGKYYSVFMIGQSPTQSLEVVEDKISIPYEGTYNVRFANYIVSASADRALDIYSRRAARVVAPNIKYKNVTDFITLPLTNISDTLDVREAGTTKTLYSFNNFIPVSRRVYTFYTYGRGTVAPFTERLLNYTNR
jgi:hypothetical protein